MRSTVASLNRGLIPTILSGLMLYFFLALSNVDLPQPILAAAVFLV